MMRVKVWEVSSEVPLKGGLGLAQFSKLARHPAWINPHSSVSMLGLVKFMSNCTFPVKIENQNPVPPAVSARGGEGEEV